MSASLFLFSLPGFAVTGHIDSQKNSRILVSEVLPDGLAFNEGTYLLKNDTNKIGINNNITICDPCGFSEACARVFPGLRPGDEILVLNGRCVWSLDLALIQTLFAEQTLHMSLRRDGPLSPAVALNHLAPPPRLRQEVRSKHHRAKSSSGA